MVYQASLGKVMDFALLSHFSRCGVVLIKLLFLHLAVEYNRAFYEWFSVYE
jgi:hypothetical protein